MATYKLEVIRRGTIIVDDVEDLEHAEEYDVLLKKGV